MVIKGTTEWCERGCTPVDTMGNRMAIVKDALIYLTRTSVGGVTECPASLPGSELPGFEHLDED